MTISFFITILVAAGLMALLYVILKFFQKFEVNNIHGLTFNYITASTFSFLKNYSRNTQELAEAGNYIYYALAIGILFILVFYIATLTAQNSGITITSISGKMSMIIPISGGIIIFNETLNITRVAGIITAITAVLLSSYRKVNESKDLHSKHRKIWLLPFLLFLGSGMVDLCIKLSEHYLITDRNQTLFIALLFGSAAIAGISITLYNFMKHKIRLKRISVLGGVILGICNYYSLEYLIAALSYSSVESSIVFSIVNVLVVVISVICALLIFKEKISKINTAGILLAILSIIILSK